MNVKAIKTHKITTSDTDILSVIDSYISQLEEGSIVVVASKILAITQGRVKELTEDEKEELIKKEADLYLPKGENAYGLFITIKNNYLTYSSGIDESNANGFCVLWPENIQESASSIRTFLKKRFNLKNIGVIITDMSALPLQWGIIAGAIGYCGFKPLKDLTGKKDLFGREFKYTKVGILQGLAAAAGVVIGEGDEQTPLGVISDVPFVEFTASDPTSEELEDLKISLEEDMYGPMIKCANWQKGG